MSSSDRRHASEANPRVRLSIIGIVVMALFCTLLARLWFLQAGAGQKLAAVATRNSVRTVQTPGLRGRLLDDKGRVLAQNRVENAILVDRKITPQELKLVVARLAFVLQVPPASIEKRINDKRISPYRPVPVATGVSIDAITFIKEHQQFFPGVDADQIPIRSYPDGSLAAHVLGYTGEVSDAELKQQRDAHYQLGETVGKSGAEQMFESELRGKPQIDKIEVDSRGKPLRTVDERSSVPGHDVQLTIDADVQQTVEQTLANAMLQVRGLGDSAKKGSRFAAPAGSVVVLNAQDGSVVAMASNPTYDPNQFLNGIPTDQFKALNDPANHFPLIDRAIQGQYAPGSTWKTFSAIAGLQTGVTSPGRVINDNGSIKVGGFTFRNAGGTRNGAISLQKALTVSSDVYFYTLGADFWGRFHRGDTATGYAIQDTARTYGFGEPTNIGLDGEAAGRIPDEAFKKDFNKNQPNPRVKAENSIWLPGDSVNLAVGQGDLLVTPLQLARGYAAFANGGNLLTPRLASQIHDYDSPTVVRDLAPHTLASTHLDPAARSTILAGLEGVPRTGTAAQPFKGFPFDKVPIAGKTGTAEVNNKSTTSLFVGIMPADNPQYVVAAVVEEAGFGSAVAAPIVRAIIEKLAGLTPGNPVVAAPRAID
jgi:penicillin-binding protein 2